jgi:hypothetical protein
MYFRSTCQIPLNVLVWLGFVTSLVHVEQSAICIVRWLLGVVDEHQARLSFFHQPGFYLAFRKHKMFEFLEKFRRLIIAQFLTFPRV